MKTFDGETDSTIIRSRTSDPFARIPKEMLEDDDLSWKAKGILCYLLGKPDDWQVRVRDLEKHGLDGPSAIRSALKELRGAGYAQLQKVYDDDGKIDYWLLVIADSACFPASTLAVSIRPEKRKKPDIENRNQELLLPDGSQPDVENQDQENRQHTKTGSATETDPNQERCGANGKASNLEEKAAKKEATRLAPLVIQHLSEATGMSFPATRSNLSLIALRLLEVRLDIDGVKKMIDRQVLKWAGGSFEQYLRPVTLFCASKFDGYYAAKDMPVNNERNGTNGHDRELDGAADRNRYLYK